MVERQFDAFSPKEIAERVQNIGLVKARLPFLSMVMLGVLAGAFIGLGAMYFVLIVSDPTLGFAVSRLLGGMAFCLGLLLVVVAGAELFTGNLVPVILGNLVGGSVLVAPVYYVIYRRGASRLG